MVNYEDYKEIFKSRKEFDLLVSKISKLDLTQDYLLVSDFDDTIFCRDEQLKSKDLQEHRGNEGNKYIIEVLGLNNFLEKYYINKKFPTEITSKLRKNKDLILTAGFEELQIEKLKACSLNHLNYIIVFNAIDKIIELIKYITNTLKYIPSEITIYEDRIKFFVEYRELIEDFLGVKLNIIEVKMNGNEGKLNLTLV